MTLCKKSSGAWRSLIRVTSACLAIAACAIDERPELTGASGAGGRPAVEASRGDAGEDPAGGEQNGGVEARDADGGGASEHDGGSPSFAEGGGRTAGTAGKGGAGGTAGAVGKGGAGGAGGAAARGGSAGRAGSAGRSGSSGSGAGASDSSGKAGVAGAGTAGAAGVAGVAGAGTAGVAGAGTAAASCGDGKVEGTEECDPWTGLGANPGHALKGSVECTYDCRLVSRPECWTCEATRCPVGTDSPDQNGDCLLEQLPGGALDTASEREVCQDLSACFWAKRCAYGTPMGTPNPLRCFCGSKEPSKCAEWPDGAADGLCAREIERAFGTTSTATILDHWRDTTYSAAGTAINRLHCDTDVNLCAEPCAP